jgi:hypothetical protein
MDEAQSELLELAAAIKTNPDVLTVENVRYEGDQIEVLTSQKMLEFTTLQQQVSLYQETYTLQQKTALTARLLWIEAAQNIKTLEAHAALVDATAAYDRVSDPGSIADSQVYQLNKELEAQLDRNRRIVEKRRLLESGTVSEIEETLKLEEMFQQGLRLAGSGQDGTAVQPEVGD